MRIDFSASYREIAALVKASARARAGAQTDSGFGTLLGSIAPGRTEPPEIRPDSGTVQKTPETSSSRDANPMARLNLSAPPLRPPKLELLPGPVLEEMPVKDEEEGVKTPAVLELRRVPAREKPSLPYHDDRASAACGLIEALGRQNGVDPALGMSVAAAESSFDPKAVSADGHFSKGLFQLLDGTGMEMHRRLGVKEPYNPFDPDQNANLGLGYLRKLHEIFSRETELPNQAKTYAAANSSSLEKLAVAAFNAGEGRVAAAQARAARSGGNPAEYDQIHPYLPESTQQYVTRVIALKADYDTLFSG